MSMQPPVLIQQKVESQRNGPDEDELGRTHAAHAPASIFSQAAHVDCVADAPTHAVTNDAISADEQACEAFVGSASALGAKPVRSQTSHAGPQSGGGGGWSHGPVCATGFAAPGPHTPTDVPSHAHAGMLLHAPGCTFMHANVAAQLSLTGNWQA